MRADDSKTRGKGALELYEDMTALIERAEFLDGQLCALTQVTKELLASHPERDLAQQRLADIRDAISAAAHSDRRKAGALAVIEKISSD